MRSSGIRWVPLLFLIDGSICDGFSLNKFHLALAWHRVSLRPQGGVAMKRYLAEFFGTFVLVFGGCGAAVLAGSHIGFVGVSFAFGLSLLAMVYTIGPISGCHINPAVTLGVLLAKEIGGRDAAAYMAAQIVGAVIGSACVLFIANGAASGYDAATAGLGANGYGAHSPGQYSLAAAFVAEIVLTMFLVLTVLGSTDIKAPVGFAGLAIGLVLT